MFTQTYLDKSLRKPEDHRHTCRHFESVKYVVHDVSALFAQSYFKVVENVIFLSGGFCLSRHSFPQSVEGHSRAYEKKLFIFWFLNLCVSFFKI